MAGVGEALLGDVPRLVPVEALLVDEDAHELGHRDDRVGVVELEDDPLRQLAQVHVARQGVLDEVAQAAGDEEVLLLQPQLLALRRRVVGVEHLGDVLGEDLRAGGLGVVAGVEGLQVEGLVGLGAPQPQGVDDAVAEAGDHVVVGHAAHLPGGDPAGALGAVGVGIRLGMPAEADLDGALGVRELPRAAQAQPAVRLLDLAALDEGLPEDAVLVADAVADAGLVHRRERVDEAGGEPPEAAVAQAGLDLLAAQRRHVDAALLHRLLGDALQVRGEQVVAELAAQEVLRREVAHDPGRVLAAPVPGLQPGRHEVGAHGPGEREVLVVDRRLRQLDALPEVELVQELTDEAVDGARRRGHRAGRQLVRRLEAGAAPVGVGGRALVGDDGVRVRGGHES